MRSRHTLLNRVRSNLEKSFSEKGDCLPWTANAGQVGKLLLYLFCLWFVSYQLVVACYKQPVLLEFRKNKTIYFFYETHLLNKKTHLHWLYTLISKFLYTWASVILSYSTITHFMCHLVLSHKSNAIIIRKPQ